MNSKLIPTFDEFAQNYRTKVDVKNLRGFREIYDTMRQNEWIMLAINLSFSDRAALAGIAKHIEAVVDFSPEFQVNLRDAAVRQTIGIMQKAILEPFGFVPDRQKKIKDKYSLEFTQASCYRYEPEKAKIKISELVKEIENGNGKFFSL